MKKVTSIAIVMFFLMPCLFTGAYAYTDYTPTEAYDRSTTDDNAYILDVRTEAEWIYVGHPGPNKCHQGSFLEDKVFNISYKIWWKKDWIINPSFASDVDELVEGLAQDNGVLVEDIVLITICRSGGRSVDAALVLEAAGYDAANIYNVVHGFQGSKDECGYRHNINGWVYDGLPYETYGKYPDPDAYPD